MERTARPASARREIRPRAFQPDASAHQFHQPLVIDPVLVYSTYLGGSGYSTDYGIDVGGDFATGLAVDAAGNVYIAGYTSSADFPVTTGAVQTTNYARGSGLYGINVFISKLNATATALIYSTYLGGTLADFAAGVAVDAAGNAYIAGETMSLDFPSTPGAFQTTNYAATCCASAFVVKLNPTGTALVYSTFLGGTGNNAYTGDGATALVVDGSGNVYVTGFASSANFPVTAGAFQTTNTAFGIDGHEAFVTKLNSSGTAVFYSTYLGGSGNNVIDGDGASGLAVDSAGNAYITGSASSFDFPVTPGAFQTTNHALANSGQNAFVTKLNPTGTALVYSTYLGGSNFEGDAALGIAVDGSGDAYIAGNTNSADFPVTSGAFQTENPAAANNASEAFVTKLNPAGSGLVYSTFLGGSGSYNSSIGFYQGDGANALVVDGSGNAYITGFARSANFPVTQGALQAANRATASRSSNAFIAELNPAGTALVYSTYLGGSIGDRAYALTLDPSGNAYIAGSAYSADFPVTQQAFQTTNHAAANRASTAFLAKLNLSGAGTSPAPAIASGGIVPVDGTVSTIQPGEWVSIFGTNPASSTATWNGDFPIFLGGTSVTVDGREAFLSYVSPGQINLQAPDDTATGTVPVLVTTKDGSATASVTLAQVGPSFFLLDGKHVAGIILKPDGSGAYGGGAYDIIGPIGTAMGYSTVAAKAGDIIELFGTGFGPTNPTVEAGQTFAGAAPTTSAVNLRINNVSITPTFAGLSGAGVYQINLAIPAGLGTGDLPLVATVGGVQTPSYVVISLQ
ncbi:MAG: SBBP repeat-containing protein [Bryobacteraceae bacterium]